MSFISEFIIIDDDKINNAVCRKVVADIYPTIEISDFIDSQEGFKYIASKYSKAKNDKTAILFLDISMPEMDAWQFLEQFEKLDASVKNHVKIYVLSQSENKDEITRMKSNKLVEYYLIKPLSHESIKLIINVLKKRLGLNID